MQFSNFAQQDSSLSSLNLYNSTNSEIKYELTGTQSTEKMPSQNYLAKWYDVFTNVPLDFYSFGKTIVNKNNIEPLAFLSVGTAASMLIDQKNWENTKILCERSPALAHITKDIVNIGDGRWQLSIAGGGILSGLILRDNKITNTSFETIEAIFSSGLFVQLAKRFTGRQSPATSNRPGGSWELFPDINEYQSDQANFYSFPSGHIATTTAILTVINENFPEVKWLKPVSYLILGALGFSLVANDMHWYSDLPFGIAAGYTFGKIVSDRFNNNNTNKIAGLNKMSFQPVISTNGFGLQLSYSFQ
jgi:membrane-associated phospholipid phosphatase